MTPAFQAISAIAIAVSLVGTWLAARKRTGWLLCIVSSVMWFPALISGDQWAAAGQLGALDRHLRTQLRTQAGP